MFKRLSVILMITILSSACAPRQVVSTQDEWKLIEEFKVRKLVVQAWKHPEDDSGYGVLYDFAVYEDGTRIRDIVVEWHDIFGRGYFLEESTDWGHVTYELYYEPPKYKHLKKKVINILK